MKHATLWIEAPDWYDDSVKEFYEKYCKNHAYMMQGFYDGNEGLWKDPSAICQLVYLELGSRGERNILKRLIKRFHKLAGDADVREVWG